MARQGAFKSEKRKKELLRQKKQEIKRQKRMGKDISPGDVPTGDSAQSEDAGEQSKEITEPEEAK